MGMQIKMHGTNLDFYVDLSQPNQCPHCNKQIAPRYIDAHFTQSDDASNYSSIAFWSCPACAKVFGVTYDINETSKNMNGLEIFDTTIGNTYPPLLNVIAVDARISEISPHFAELFQHAQIAKACGLLELAGMGFRKALECLLKDSLISLHIVEKEKAKELSLVNSIKAFSDNPRLQKAANQARVIGNDYTHYEARYEGYDIEVLMKLIKITIHWLSMEFDTQDIEPLINK